MFLVVEQFAKILLYSSRSSPFPLSYRIFSILLLSSPICNYFFKFYQLYRYDSLYILFDNYSKYFRQHTLYFGPPNAFFLNSYSFASLSIIYFPYHPYQNFNSIKNCPPFVFFVSPIFPISYIQPFVYFVKYLYRVFLSYLASLQVCLTYSSVQLTVRLFIFVN